MTCDACRELLYAVDLRAGTHSGVISDADVRALEEHVAGCEQCAQDAARLRDGEAALRDSLAADQPSSTPELWARAAMIRVRHRRRAILFGSPVLAASIGIIAWMAWKAGGGIVRDMDADFGRVEVETFSLTCLAPEQAEQLLRPYMPNERSWAWSVGHGIRAVTVRAPRETLDRVPGILARFEKDSGAACRAGATPQAGRDPSHAPLDR